MTIHVSLEGNALEALAKLNNPATQRRVLVRAFARAKRDVARLAVRHVKAEVKAATTKRTGALLKVKADVRADSRDLSLTVLPKFPSTAYVTASKRRAGIRGLFGQRTRARRGQYAFVLNAGSTRNRSRGFQFIGKGLNRVAADPKLAEILSKHILFILRQELNL